VTPSQGLQTPGRIFQGLRNLSVLLAYGTLAIIIWFLPSCNYVQLGHSSRISRDPPEIRNGARPPGKTPAFARSARKRDAGKPLEPRGGEVLVVEVMEVVEVGTVMATN
jgi:hypothetical protein